MIRNKDAACSEGAATSTKSTDKSDDAETFSTDLHQYREEYIRPLMDLNDHVNSLTMEETKINATRIVVAGDQSHGKTSLLEALCGIDLPRGEGIQTRVPLILQLRQDDTREYATIKVEKPNVLGGTTVHSEEIPFLDNIGDKVREYTTIAAGSGKNIVGVPIELKIFRRNVDDGDLTLVDLPGITRVALKDQANGDGKMLEKSIMKMCKKYMSPQESILLNVVSAMVDFSTSASLQLSHELDKDGNRTMLCITKVDQHSEEGLHDKIQKSIHAMKLKPQHVFAVRNRTQKENDKNLPLSKVRELEQIMLEQLAEGRICEYQLGIKALSKYLVKIQCEEILQTLPRTRKTIEQVVIGLEEELESLGEPIGTVAECKAKAVQLIDACANRLEGEANGRIHTELDTNNSNCEGEDFELSFLVNDIQAAAAKRKEIESEKIQRGDITFQTSLEFSEDEKQGVGFYLSISTDCGDISEVSIACTFVASHGEQQKRRHMEHCYELTKGKPSGCGYSPLLTLKEVSGQVSFSAHVFVDSVTKGEREGEEYLRETLLCARLADLQDEFSSSIDTLYSNNYFFSEAFRKRIARELQGSRGGIGLPGTVASHVPVTVLRNLRTKLPGPIADYRDKVLEECIKTCKNVIESYVAVEQHPKLRSILVECAAETFNDKASELEHYHEKILEWEENVCSSNHYFMDTVNSVRASVYDYGDSDDDDEGKPAYLRHLTAESIAAMSNADQKLVDQQIEIFAYWKLMKKRLIDYVLLSTQGDLVSTPIHKLLKSRMLELVFCRDDDELVVLMSPDEHIVKGRANVASRLKKLNKALAEIDAYRMKYPGGFVSIE